MRDVVNSMEKSVDLVTIVVNEGIGDLLAVDALSVQSAKQLLPTTLRVSNDEKHFDLGDIIDWDALVRCIPDTDAHRDTVAPATTQADAAIPAPPVAAPVGLAAPNLPVVEWLQWGVIARLVVVAFVFSYNRNMTTEKLTAMAVVYTLSYFFQIGAFGYWFALACHKLGLNLNRPPLARPVAAAAAAPVPAPAPADGQAGAIGGIPGAVNARAVPAGGVAPGPAPAQAAAPPQPPLAGPVGFLQSLITLYHSGLTIPTSPGLLMDLVSLLMGMFFSIVPGWVPYRLH